MIISIDPGQKGAIAALTEKGWQAVAMPDSVAGIVKVIQGYAGGRDAVLVVERAQAMPKQGVTGVFTYGQHFGCFEAIAACLSLQYVTIRPAEWKKAMGLNSDKTSSIIEAERLFPTVSLLPTSRCKKPSDGMAEALLLGEYARRKGL